MNFVVRHPVRGTEEIGFLADNGQYTDGICIVWKVIV